MDLLKDAPKWALRALAVSVAILFTFAIFDGRRVDFWPPVIHEKSEGAANAAKRHEEIEQLKKELSTTQSYLSPQETLQMFPEKVRRKTVQGTADEVLTLVEVAAAQNTELDVLKEKVRSIENIEGDFLFRILTFHNEARCFGDSLNFTHPPLDPEKCAKKEELAKRFLGFLAEIEFYEGPIVESPESAKRELIQYQESKMFGRKGWYGRDVFKWIIIDYYGKA